MAINFPDGTQNFSGKVVQVKHFATATKTRITNSGYYWGGQSNGDGGLAFTMKSTSNKIYISAGLAYGRNNINGGTKLLVSGNTGYWSSQTTTTYVGGSNAYTGAFNTGEDGHGTGQDYGIGISHLSLISSSTMPSTFYLGFYWHLGSGSGHLNFNRQENDNGGNAVSGMMIMELEDVS